jgi:hypothetical protein
LEEENKAAVADRPHSLKRARYQGEAPHQHGRLLRQGPHRLRPPGVVCKIDARLQPEGWVRAGRGGFRVHQPSVGDFACRSYFAPQIE